MNTKNEKTSDKKVDELKRSRSSGELKSLKVQKLNGKPRRDSEDEFTLGGKRYVAKSAVGCERHCAFFEMMPRCRKGRHHRLYL